MKRSEKILALITIIAALVVFLANRGALDPSSLNFDALRVGESEIEAAEAEAERTEDILSRSAIVDARYEHVVSARLQSIAADRDPLEAFTDEVESLPKKIGLNIRLFNIEAATREPYDELPDYEYITLAVTYKQVRWPDVVRLLKGYEDAGLLITELQLNAILDSPEMTVRVRVAREALAETALKKAKAKQAAATPTPTPRATATPRVRATPRATARPTPPVAVTPTQTVRTPRTTPIATSRPTPPSTRLIRPTPTPGVRR